MKPNNNSDNDLLVWADWLDENGYERIAEDVRDEVENHTPETPWHHEYHNDGAGVGGVGGINVGSDIGDGISVGIGGIGGIGGGFGNVGGGFNL